MVSAVRKRAVLAAAGGALLLTGVGFGAAAASGAIGGTETVSDSAEVSTATEEPAAPTTTAQAPAPTVESVTKPAEPTPLYEETKAATSPSAARTPGPAAVSPTQAPQPAPAPVPAADAPAPQGGVGTTDAEGNYTPAPPIPREGEPPVGVDERPGSPGGALPEWPSS